MMPYPTTLGLQKVYRAVREDVAAQRLSDVEAAIRRAVLNLPRGRIEHSLTGPKDDVARILPMDSGVLNPWMADTESLLVALIVSHRDAEASDV